MDFTKIMTISGKPGLYLLSGQTKNGVIVESLTDGKKMAVFAHERMSTLEEITVYTETEDRPLKEILKTLKEHLGDEPAPNPKKASADDLKKLFDTIVPDYDRDAVYVSDIKKIFSWYNFLKSKDMLVFDQETPEESTPEKTDAGRTDEDTEEKITDAGKDPSKTKD